MDRKFGLTVVFALTCICYIPKTPSDSYPKCLNCLLKKCLVTSRSKATFRKKTHNYIQYVEKSMHLTWRFKENTEKRM